MELCQIWKCLQPGCGARRVWGNASAPDILVKDRPLLLCEKGCAKGRHVQHSFVHLEQREWDSMRGKWVRVTGREVM